MKRWKISVTNDDGSGGIGEAELSADTEEEAKTNFAQYNGVTTEFLQNKGYTVWAIEEVPTEEGVN